MGHEVDIQLLKEITDALFEHITNDLKIRYFKIKDSQDYYWEIPTNTLFEVAIPQPSLSIGRLSDDWEFLEGISRNKNEAVSLMLLHLAPLLRAIGEDVGQ